MVNVAPYKRGQWLRVDDVKTGDLITFLDGGEEVDGFQGKPAVEFNIRLSDNSEIKITPNRPSISALAEAWGDEAENWIGKQAIIEIKSEIINGEDKEFIVLTPNDDGEPSGSLGSTEPIEVADEEIPVVDD